MKTFYSNGDKVIREWKDDPEEKCNQCTDNCKDNEKCSRLEHKLTEDQDQNKAKE